MIARLQIDFLPELRVEDDAVVVRCALAKLGTSSVTTREGIRVGDELAVEAEAVLVARDPETSRSRPLRDAERLGLERTGLENTD